MQFANHRSIEGPALDEHGVGQRAQPEPGHLGAIEILVDTADLRQREQRIARAFFGDEAGVLSERKNAAERCAAMTRPTSWASKT